MTSCRGAGTGAAAALLGVAAGAGDAATGAAGAGAGAGSAGAACDAIGRLLSTRECPTFAAFSTCRASCVMAQGVQKDT